MGGCPERGTHRPKSENEIAKYYMNNNNRFNTHAVQEQWSFSLVWGSWENFLSRNLPTIVFLFFSLSPSNSRSAFIVRAYVHLTLDQTHSNKPTNQQFKLSLLCVCLSLSAWLAPGLVSRYLFVRYVLVVFSPRHLPCLSSETTNEKERSSHFLVSRPPLSESLYCRVGLKLVDGLTT